MNNGRVFIRKRYVFHGRVQGVGFRFTSARLARVHHLTGWVRNQYDGSVLMEIQGSPFSIQDFMAELTDDRYIELDDIEIKSIDIVPDEKVFRILH